MKHLFKTNYLKKLSIIAKTEHSTDTPRIDLVGQVVEEGDVIVIYNVQTLSLSENLNLNLFSTDNHNNSQVRYSELNTKYVIQL